jgi:hypothetical protein
LFIFNNHVIKSNNLQLNFDPEKKLEETEANFSEVSSSENIVSKVGKLNRLKNG